MEKKLTILAALLLSAPAFGTVTVDGWTDVRDYLVSSDGSRSLGSDGGSSSETRDSGSKLLFFDTARGDSAGAEVYWWDGTNIIDSDDSSTTSTLVKPAQDGFAFRAEPIYTRTAPTSSSQLSLPINRFYKDNGPLPTGD